MAILNTLSGAKKIIEKKKVLITYTEGNALLFTTESDQVLFSQSSDQKASSVLSLSQVPSPGRAIT